MDVYHSLLRSSRDRGVNVEIDDDTAFAYLWEETWDGKIVGALRLWRQPDVRSQAVPLELSTDERLVRVLAEEHLVAAFDLESRVCYGGVEAFGIENAPIDLIDQ